MSSLTAIVYTFLINSAVGLLCAGVFTLITIKVSPLSEFAISAGIGATFGFGLCTLIFSILARAIGTDVATTTPPPSKWDY